MEWTQAVTAIFSAGITFSAIFVVYRGLDNRFILDEAAKTILDELRHDLHEEREKRKEQAVTIEKLQVDLDRYQRSETNFIIRLDQRDARVKDLQDEVVGLKAKIDKISHEYKEQVTHWQQRAIDAEQELFIIKQKSLGRKL